MASRKNAIAICDICGLRFRHAILKKNSYGMMVCPNDWEGSYDNQNHWQNKNPKTDDNEFIKNPRPPANNDRNAVWESVTSKWEDTTKDWNTI